MSIEYCTSANAWGRRANGLSAFRLSCKPKIEPRGRLGKFNRAFCVVFALRIPVNICYVSDSADRETTFAERKSCHDVEQWHIRKQPIGTKNCFFRRRFQRPQIGNVKGRRSGSRTAQHATSKHSRSPESIILLMGKPWHRNSMRLFAVAKSQAKGQTDVPRFALTS